MIKNTQLGAMIMKVFTTYVNQNLVVKMMEINIKNPSKTTV